MLRERDKRAPASPRHAPLHAPAPAPPLAPAAHLNGYLILGILTGILHTLVAKQEIVLSIVPVDIVVNTVIAAGWETTKQQTNEDDIKIYNVTNNRSPMLWKDLSKVLNIHLRNLVSPRTIWYCFVIETTNEVIHLICTLFLHFIPAFFVDSACKLLNKQPILTKIYKKFTNYQT
ncbi:unnamed protein product [Parnassius apollo]|uniref:(apollo) hypothetical protein n=1 Tax=Parnassius apollo TaxID=110799 RepID=A0A8S3WBS2_PARAO|nr:unnamed protein product [Parnassius apollo]